MTADIREKIDNRSATIGVVGLGYVGLPVACLFASKGFDVIGVDLKVDRVDIINAGQSPIEGDEPGLADLLAAVVRSGKLRATTDMRDLAGADAVTINVETPVDDDHKPHYNALRAACGLLGSVVQDGTLIIVESTIGPGTMTGVVQATLAAVAPNKTFRIGHCPERVMPGKLLGNLRTVSRVLGSDSADTGELMLALYRHVVEADLDVADLLTAELVKTSENAYRDVNIAFANELALICQEVGGDVWRVRELVNKSPGRNVLFPGAGVGGHCIPKDPWLLVSAFENPQSASLITTARAVNDAMPAQVVTLVLDCLAESGVRPTEAKVAVLGYAYLEDSDDIRNSPSEQFVKHMSGHGCQLVIHDPHVAPYQGDVYAALRDCDCAVVLVAHSMYRHLELSHVRDVMRHPSVVDTRRVLSQSDMKRNGFAVRVLGAR